MYGFISLSCMQPNRVIVNWVFKLILKLFTDILRIVDRKLYYLTNFSKQRLSILFFKHLLDYYHQRELSSLIHIRPNFCLTFSRRISISIYFQDHFQISFYVSTSISDLDRRHWLISVLVGVRGLHRTA